MEYRLREDEARRLRENKAETSTAVWSRQSTDAAAATFLRAGCSPLKVSSTPAMIAMTVWLCQRLLWLFRPLFLTPGFARMSLLLPATMAGDPAFSPELFAIIIGMLADDLETRRSCALVSRSFHDFARIFSRLQVGPRVDQEHDICRLCELLEGSPAFAMGVESLRVCSRVYTQRNKLTPRSWLMEADLGRCLSVLVSLTRLCIVTDGNYLSWHNDISVANRNSIQVILPALTCLDLCGVGDFPLTILSYCSALRSLILNDVNFDHNPEPDPTVAIDRGSRIQLQHLSLKLRIFSGLPQFVNWIASPESPVDISCLRSLEFTVDSPMNHSLLQRLLNASSRSLRRLCVKNCPLFMQKRHELDLHKFPHLHTLCLDMHLNDSPQGNHFRLLSISNFVFPPQLLALDLGLSTPDERIKVAEHLADADGVLAPLPFKTVTITLLLRAWPEKYDKEKLIDVFDEFVPVMPLLPSKLGRTGALRILESLPLETSNLD
ncbi:hypothetical protein MSAN_01231300 [Mycena sanguinolenta]|uniref:F-box domain-containing protein n=1 Tax=Mycena sanguinolenta TaxID=230812 RepID=A0A8H6YIL1_9AGAR|nr:hypothetical protein MSAN_01231300 [Mycena sanguinolenta]